DTSRTSSDNRMAAGGWTTSSASRTRPAWPHRRVGPNDSMLAFAALSLVVTLHDVPAVCPRVRTTVRDEYRGSDVVVVGTVVRATAVPLSRDFQEGTAYLVRVNETLKGRAPAQLRLFSEN